MTRIFITGDTHGDIDMQKLDKFAVNNLDLTKDDYVVVTGDFGVPWKTPYEGHISKSDKKILNHYDAYPWTTLFIDGNHDNFDALSQFPVIDWMGGKAQKISDSVIHLCRSQIFTIGDSTFLTLGGAESIDAAYRTPGKSWWREESITYADLNTAAENLEKFNNKVDFIITHDMPSDLFEKYFLFIHDKWDISSSSRALSNIYNNVDYKRWFFGHHHVDITDEKHIGLYNLIIDLDDFNENVNESKFFCSLS